MERRHHRNPAERAPLPAERRDPGPRPEQRLRRGRSQSDDDLGRDRLDLPEEERRAGGDLVRLRVAIAGRPALDDVRDVDLLARIADRADHLVELLTGASDERLAARVLVGPGALADEHQSGVRIADAEDDVRARLAELAPPAIPELLPHLLERGRHVPCFEQTGIRGGSLGKKGLSPFSEPELAHAQIAEVADPGGERPPDVGRVAHAAVPPRTRSRIASATCVLLPSGTSSEEPSLP